MFKWPDGRHYIGDFVNAQMHGFGKMSWQEHDGEKCVYKGQMLANVIHGDGELSKSNGDFYKGEF